MIQFKNLIGYHKFTGCDSFTKLHDVGDSDFINFTLDGITYTAIEDDNDGYRSCMGELYESDKILPNTFTCYILARLVEDDNSQFGESFDALELIDLGTGKEVLRVGTGNTDDYYPYFIASFYPQNMTQNLSVVIEERKKLLGGLTQ